MTTKRQEEEILRIERSTGGNCSFLKIEKMLDRADGILHFGGIVANDYPFSNDMVDAHLTHIRKMQLKDSLGEACTLLVDVIEMYEQLIHVHGCCIGASIRHLHTYFCRECVECPEDWELTSAKLDHRKPCTLRDIEVYTGIRDRIETNIENLANLLVVAEDEKHGCGEFPYKPEITRATTVREVIGDWIKKGYYRDHWNRFSEE